MAVLYVQSTNSDGRLTGNKAANLGFQTTKTAIGLCCVLVIALCAKPAKAAYEDHALSLDANCDWIMKIFLDGVEHHDPVTMVGWGLTSTLTVPGGTRVIAIECQAEAWVGGILASLSNGQVTDKTWQCSPVFEPGWTEPDFEPTSPNWTPAFEIVQNGGSMPTWTWAKCHTCSSRAMWIWTSDFRNDMPGYVTAYCRVNIEMCPDGCENGLLPANFRQETATFLAGRPLLSTTHRSSGRLSCVKECATTIKCETLSYEPGTQNCTLYEWTEGQSTYSLMPRAGFQVFSARECQQPSTAVPTQVVVSIALSCPTCVGTYDLLPATYHHQRPVYKMPGSERYLKADRQTCRWTIQDGSATLMAFNPEPTFACDPTLSFDHD